MQKLNAGEAQGFMDISLYDLYAPTIFMYVYQQLGHQQDAEDVLLEVFVAALSSERFAGLSNGEQMAWLRKVARNKDIVGELSSTRHHRLFGGGNQPGKARNRCTSMFCFFHPFNSAKDIHGTSGEKSLESELLAANVACLPHLTGTHGLRNGAFNACSCGVQLPKFGGSLSLASVIESGVARFIWAQDQDFRRNRCTLGMKGARAAEPKREANAKARLAMPIGD